MNKLDEQYINTCKDILNTGIIKEDRTGTGTIATFGNMIKVNMKDGYPLLTTKKMATKQIITELLWFLRGETNIQRLVKEGNNIWVGDAYKAYLKNSHDSNHSETALSKNEFIEKIKTDDNFAIKFGELGPVYGKQWRNWNGIDQIANLINTLQTNPDSRRMMINAWKVDEIDKMTLPPCHYNIQVVTRKLTFDEKIRWVMSNRDIDMENLAITEEASSDRTPDREISLAFNMRSVDMPLGFPFNIASYGALLIILGRIVNMVPGTLTAFLGDTHIYSNQVDGIKEQITRTNSYTLPYLKLDKSDTFFNEVAQDISKLSELQFSDFKILNYKSHPGIKFPLSN